VRSGTPANGAARAGYAPETSAQAVTAASYVCWRRRAATDCPYRLSLVLAHQHMGQLPKDVRDALGANARTKVVFTCSPEDAFILERHFTPDLSAYDSRIWRLSRRRAGHASGAVLISHVAGATVRRDDDSTVFNFGVRVEVVDDGTITLSPNLVAVP
jgi:hypothetical protein